jgi:serine/threonine-protein kinase RsbW
LINQRFILSHGGDDVRQAQEAVLRTLEDCKYDAGSCFAIRLALEEALSNAFKHGNQNNPELKVTMQCSVGDDCIEIEIEDQGEGFDPDAVPDPTVDENIEIPSGRGIVLMRSFMTEVRYEPPGNRLRMRFNRPDPDAEEAAAG